MKSPEERDLRDQADQARARLERLTADLGVVDAEVERLAPQRARHELLEQACVALEKLDELGAGALFWGERSEPRPAAERLRDARVRVREFQARLGELDARRGGILAAIGLEEENLEILGEDLYQIREAEERRKLEWVIEREIGPSPRHPQRMAWARGGEDDRRFLRSLSASLAGGLAFGALLPMIDLPAPDRFVPADVPRRIAQLVRESQPKPLPPPVAADRPDEPARPDRREPEPSARPRPEAPESPAVAAAESMEAPAPGPLAPGVPGTPGSEPEPPKKAGKAGILAFKDEFASLAQDKVAPRLGREARYGEGEETSKVSTRSMLTTQAPGSSGGINLASLSRSVGRGGGGGGAGALHGGGGGGGGGGGIDGVAIGRAASPIAAVGGGDDRPLARDGASASRTDEEIQIVFDRYKSSFYRLYNRELRKDPTLRGQMVLRLTIEPDGSVSMCVLQASDMRAPELAAQVVDRVRTINFGAKDGVQALTIVYPIDFLPAA